MQISEQVISLLKQHPELFDDEQGFNKLYAHVKLLPATIRSEVTALIYEAGTDPLQHVNFIAPYMFNNIKLDNITVPSNVEKVFAHGFYNIAAKTISFDNPDCEIRSHVFFDCNVDTITLPDNLNYIESCAFEHCGLFYITYLGTIEQWHKIRKDSDWNNGSSVTYINCLDGRLHL